MLGTVQNGSCDKSKWLMERFRTVPDQAQRGPGNGLERFPIRLGTVPTKLGTVPNGSQNQLATKPGTVRNGSHEEGVLQAILET